MLPLDGGQRPPAVGGEPGDMSFTGANGEIYDLTQPILFTVPAEDLKNIPCFLKIADIIDFPKFPKGHTLYDFFFAEDLPEALPKIYALPNHTFVTYPDGLVSWYMIKYFVGWSDRGCEILDCALYFKSDAHMAGVTYVGSVWGDMFYVLSPCRPLEPFQNKVSFEKDIIVFRPYTAKAPNPFEDYQPK